MLMLQPKPTFKAKCLVTVPGNEKPVTITVIYKHKTREELRTWLKKLSDSPAETQVKDDCDTLMEILCGWEDIDGEFTESNLREFLNNYPAAGMELFETYKREVMESRRKNS